MPTFTDEDNVNDEKGLLFNDSPLVDLIQKRNGELGGDIEGMPATELLSGAFHLTDAPNTKVMFVALHLNCKVWETSIMGNHNQKRVRKKAQKLQAKVDRENKATRHAFDGNAAPELIESRKLPGSTPKKERRRIESDEIFAAIFGAGVGMLSNHISGDPRILYLASVAICIPVIWHIWPRGRTWRISQILA